jgi:hypothetical protein
VTGDRLRQEYLPFYLAIDDLIPLLVQNGWEDDEILDHIERVSRPSLRQRREAAAHLAALRAAGHGSGEPTSVSDVDSEARGLKRLQILRAKSDHDASGHTSLATHRRLGVSYSTLLRARRDLGLVPWPRD